MNTEQRARFEAWYGDNRADAPTAWETFQAAETPLLARIAELERQLANREPFVVAMPCIIEIKDTKYPYDVPSIYYLATEVITAIEAAGGMVKI